MAADTDSSESKSMSIFGDSDKGPCCTSLGRTGSAPANRRWEIMMFCALMVTTSAILACVAATGLSLDSTHTYPWVTAKRDRTFRGVHTHAEFYGGLSGKDFSWKNFNATTKKLLGHNHVVQSWRPSKKSCDLTSCGPCHESSIAAATLVILSIVFSMPTLVMACRRAEEKSDGNGEKVTGMIGAFLAFLCCLISALLYWCNCVEGLPPLMRVVVKAFGSAPYFVKMEYNLGVGMYCVVFATIFQFLALLSFCSLPSPAPVGSEEEYLLGPDLESPEKVAEMRASEQEEVDQADLENKPGSAYEDSFLTNPASVKSIHADSPKVNVTKDPTARPETAEPTKSAPKPKGTAAAAAINASLERRRRNADEMSQQTQMSSASKQSDML